MQNKCLQILPKHFIFVLVVPLGGVPHTGPVSKPLPFPAVDTGKEIYPSFKSQCYFSQSHLISHIVAVPGAQADCERRGSSSPPSARMLSSALYYTEVCLLRALSADMEKECLERSLKRSAVGRKD